ncbi:MAG: hypothetical protein D6689_16760 [Deltaproteobacteria bacterium]|nr:MAG: hypothetical protein D6689_16760 [Deltaproteobacteria bacterium]
MSTRMALVVASVALGACLSRRRAPDADYADDVRKICHAERLSGALEVDPNARQIHVAQWLGRALVTAEARALMARQAALPPAERAAVLREAAAAVGLAGCPTADTWAPPGRTGPAEAGR